VKGSTEGWWPAVGLLAVILVAAAPLSGQRSAPDIPPPPVHRLNPDSIPRPSLVALRVTTPITVDGSLDEGIWFAADSADGFFQSLPRDGMPASDSTVVRVLYDAENLYIGAMLYDPHPDRLMVPGLEQDFRTENADLFGVAIDTYHDRANAFLFAVNPAGALFDAQNFNDSRYTNRAWEGIVTVATQVLDDGWSVEMAIPFTTLRFNANRRDQVWGINFLRRSRRRGEDSYWAPLARQYRVHKMSRAGTLTGLRDLRQGRNLTFKPYVSATQERGVQALGKANDLDGGVDIKYGVTSRLTLDLSVLTDFSQVEVDQEQINLTRFSLFFPEQRDFFLENDGIFSLGDVGARNYRTGSSSRNFRLFHSRRIGLSASRQALPIAGGGRLTGRAGDFELGFLNMQTQSSTEAAAENFSVARIRRNLLGNSDVGLIFINRQGTTAGNRGDFNRTWGADANFQIKRNLLINAYAATTDDPGPASGNQRAAWLQVAWRDRVWDTSAFIRHVGDAFNPEVGFVRRRGIREAFGTFGAHPQPRVPGVQEINPYIDVDYVADLDGSLETRRVKAGLAVRFVPGDALTFEVTDNLEQLDSITRIIGVPVAAGRYAFRDVSVNYRASGARWISGDVRLSHGDFFDGRRTSISGRLIVRPTYHLQLDLTAQHNDLDLGGRNFTADLYGARVRYAYNTKVFLSSFVQYNRAADELIANVRFNLIHAPLSDIFIVYTERRDLADTPRALGTLLDRVVTLKVTRLFGF